MKLFKYINMFLITVLILSFVNTAFALSITSTSNAYENIPSEINDDYYDVSGGPHLQANLVSDNIYSRSDDATLYVNIVNDGKITSFETKDDNVKDDIAQYTQAVVQPLMAKELELDKSITTANSIVATLSIADPNTPLKIKQKTLLLGSLTAGRPLAQPAAFPIEIYDNATPGTYNLNLNVSYNYQKDSAIRPPFGDVYMWNTNASQNLILQVVVDNEPYFKVRNMDTKLSVGNSDDLKVTYKNEGKIVAKECTARISVVDPFTTTDDQAYLGDMQPGESKNATFKINVANDATPKNYSIDSEIRYKDIHDDNKYSRNLKVELQVQPSKSFIEKLFSGTGLILLILLITGIVGVAYMLSKKNQDE